MAAGSLVKARGFSAERLWSQVSAIVLVKPSALKMICSETTVGVVSAKSKEPSDDQIVIGAPTGANPVYILDEDLKLMPWGCIGEICVGGEQVCQGYTQESLNDAVFLQHEEFGRLYKTGDLGRHVVTGREEVSLVCLGRKDGQVKINGLR